MNHHQQLSTVVLLACASKKLDRPAPACELYQSHLFTESLAYAHQLKPHAIHILSALHGLLPLNKVIKPYNHSLNHMRASDIRLWSEKVLGSLCKLYPPASTHFILLAGQNYRKNLAPHFPHHSIPLEGLRIGEQLKRLKELNS